MKLVVDYKSSCVQNGITIAALRKKEMVQTARVGRRAPAVLVLPLTSLRPTSLRPTSYASPNNHINDLPGDNDHLLRWFSLQPFFSFRRFENDLLDLCRSEA